MQVVLAVRNVICWCSANRQPQTIITHKLRFIMSHCKTQVRGIIKITRSDKKNCKLIFLSTTTYIKFLLVSEIFYVRLGLVHYLGLCRTVN